MSRNFLIVDKAILPDYYDKVIEARNLLSSGRVREISEAVKIVGISRSTYYKYKDYVFAPSAATVGRNAVLSFLLTHEKGILSAALNVLSEYGASVLTITQSLPVNNQASVTVSIDTSSMTESISAVLESLEKLNGVSQIRLIAVE